jgi:hypothetical protein
MTAYLALFLVAGPWPGTHGVPATAHALARDVSLPGIAIAAFLSWRVARGSSFARGLILVWTILSLIGTFMSSALQSGSLVPCWLLAGSAGQLALVLSAPVYARTRKFPVAAEPGRAVLWPVPPVWTLAAAAVLTVLGMLLGMGSMDYRPGPGCTSASCRTLGQGYPVHFLATADGVSLGDGVRSFFADLAAAAYNAGALAADLALWFLAAFALIYLLWIPSRRPPESPPLTSLAVSDSPAG